MSPLDRTWVVKKDPRTRSKDEMTSHWVEAASPDPTPADVSATDRSTNRVWLSRPRRARHSLSFHFRPINNSLCTLLIKLCRKRKNSNIVFRCAWSPRQTHSIADHNWRLSISHVWQFSHHSSCSFHWSIDSHLISLVTLYCIASSLFVLNMVPQICPCYVNFKAHFFLGNCFSIPINMRVMRSSTWVGLHVSHKGSRPLPKQMNFRKSSKRQKSAT